MAKLPLGKGKIEIKYLLTNKLLALKKSSRLTIYIFAGMILGIAVGYILRIVNPGEQWLKHFSDNISIITDIFLRLIKMIIAPLVLTTLVVGVAKMGDLRAVGRVGGKTMVWFVSASFVSLFIGLILVNLLKPGDMLHLQLPGSGASPVAGGEAMTLRGFITHVFPQSIAEAMAGNEILQIVVFALFFGVATAALGKRGVIIVEFLDAVSQVMFLVTGYVMKLAPLAVFAAMASVVAEEGLEILWSYGIFILEFYVGLILLWTVIALAGYLVIGKRSFRLLGKIKDPYSLPSAPPAVKQPFPRSWRSWKNSAARTGSLVLSSPWVIPLTWTVP